MSIASVEANLTDVDDYSGSHPQFSSSVDTNANTWNFFSEEEVLSWTPQEISQIDPLEIDQITLHQIRLLTPKQLQSFTPEQISALTVDQISALGSEGSKASLKDLSHSQLEALNDFALPGLGSLQPLEQLEALSAEQFEVLYAAKKDLPFLIQEYFGHRVGEELSSKRWSLEEVQQISVNELQERDFTPSEIRELFLSHHIQHFSPQQITSIQPELMKFFWSIPFLSIKQVKALTSRQIVYFSASQLNLFSKLQIQAFEKNQILTINFRSDIEKLSRSFVQALFPKVTADVIRSLSVEQIAHETNPRAAQGSGRLRSKLIIAHCKVLNREQFQAIHPEAMQFIGIADLKDLTMDQMSNLLPEQISRIKSDQCEGFAESQIAQLTKKQIQALTPSQIRAMSDFWGPIRGIRSHQLHQFLPDQISGFGTEDRLKEFLKADRIGLLREAQLHALAPEQIRVLAGSWEIRQALISRRNELNFAQQQALQ